MEKESFSKLANKLCVSTTIIHVTPEEISSYKDSNPFSEAIAVNGIFKMHVMVSDGQNSFLWLNSEYHQSGKSANISLSQGNVNNDTCEKEKLPLKHLSYHDVVKVVKGDFLGYFAIVTETGDLSNLSSDDEIEINYLKKSYGKWVVVDKDLDSIMIGDLEFKEAEVDGRSRYTIIE